MRAAIYRGTGPAHEVLRVENLDDPEPHAGEVRVRVYVSGVNPTDWKARTANAPLSWPWKIPNQDGAGVIDAVGDHVEEARVGDRVWVYHAAYERQGGTAAQYVTVPAPQAVPLPDNVSFEQGAGLGVPYLTASNCLRAAGGNEGAAGGIEGAAGGIDGLEVLITGGAGAVGNAAIQLATQSGARVIATVSSPEKAALARSAGADVVLNYRDPDFREQLADHAVNGVDLVVDVGFEKNVAAYAHVLGVRSHIASYASTPDPTVELPLGLLRSRNVTVRFMLIYGVAPSALERAVDDVGKALAAGSLRPLPPHRFKLDDIADAHDAVERGAVGKVVVAIP